MENNFPLNDGRGIIKVEVSMDINGNIDKKVGINNVYEMDSLSSNVVGLIGVPVEIRSNASFDTATIRFTYDETAVISFNSSAKIVSDFTNNQIELSKKVNSLTASGGTNVNNGLLKTLEVFDGRETDRRRIIVLICDGDVNYYQSTIDKCIENEIQIYAVNLLNSSSHLYLQKMADQTNGQYYYGSSVNDLSGMLGIIQDDTINKIDPTDNDSDGLYDIYETAGIKLPNGQIIYTDPALKDTDGDGLTDFEETGIVYNVDDRYIGLGTYKKVKYFIMNSDPTAEDTDFDGIGDKEDSSPWFADQVTKDLSNKYKDVEYLNVGGLNGGNQNWWYDKTNLHPDNMWDKYTDYILSPDYRMESMGCGVVAMTDLELYMTQQNDGYSIPSKEITYDNADGSIEKDDYMKYAEYNRDNLYYLGDNTLNYLTGVLPANMELGIMYYLTSNNHPYTNANWAPYCGGKSDTKTGIANKIETMISRDLPVVFSFYASSNSKEDRLKLYTELKYAKEKNTARSKSVNENPNPPAMLGRIE